jgi:hypothetical protein
MKNKWFGLLAGAILVLTLSIATFGQGKSNGKGNGNGNGKGNSGTVVDQIPGIKDDNNSNRGQGKNKKNDPIGGIFDDDHKGKGNSNRFKGLSKKTGIPESQLKARYEIEKRLNPDLTYGQFVAAHMVAKNHRGVSTGDILGGLRNGDSIGQILHDKGWDKGKIDKERKRIKKDREKDKDRDYDDDDRTWRLPF